MHTLFDGSNPDLIDAERAAFEADAAPYDFDLTRVKIAAPEPWAEYADDATGHRWGGWLAASAQRDLRSEKSTRRSVACVKACEGLETDLLEKIVALGSTLPRRLEAMTNWERSEAETQRNDLVDAIRRTLDENGHLADGDVCTLKRLKDVLAKVDAGAGLERD